MRYYLSNQQAKARLAQEMAYRDIAAKATADQADAAAAVGAIQSSLSEIAMRLVAIEKILREVE